MGSYHSTFFCNDNVGLKLQEKLVSQGLSERLLHRCYSQGEMYLLSETLCQRERDQRRNIPSSFSFCLQFPASIPQRLNPAGNQLIRKPTDIACGVQLPAPQKSWNRERRSMDTENNQHSYKDSIPKTVPGWIFVKMLFLRKKGYLHYLEHFFSQITINNFEL